MKLNDLRRSTVLLEADIVNIDEIDRYVAGIAGELEDRRSKDWFQTKVSQWIRRSRDDLHHPMTDANRPAVLPAWATERMQQDPEHQFHVFVPSDDLSAQLAHLIDYFNGLPPDSDVWEKLPTMGVQKTIVYAERWVEDAVRQHRNGEADEGLETVLMVGGLRWVRHHNLQTVKRDGAILRNCLAQDVHTAGIVSGQKIVYTLRDASNKPHVAFMLMSRGATVGEIKGKGNRPPVGRYTGATKELLNALKLPAEGTAVSDISAMGLFYDSRKQTYGTIIDLTETVMELDGGYVVGRKPSREGEEFYIAQPNRPQLIKLMLRTNGDLEFGRFEQGQKALIRPLVQTFVNTYWPGGAPPPHHATSGGWGNRTPQNFLLLDLAYDYHSKKYGLPEEIGQEVFQGQALGGYRVAVWGQTRFETTYTLIDHDNQPFAELRFGTAKGSPAVSDIYAVDMSITPSEDTSRYSQDFEQIQPLLPAITEFLNTGFGQAPPPKDDIYSNRGMPWREQADLFYDFERKLYAPFLEASRVVYRFRDGMEVRKWQEDEDLYYSFIKNGQKVYELYRYGRDGNRGSLALHDRNWSGKRETPKFGKDLTPRQKADLAKRMIEMLNRSPEFTEQSLEDIATSFPDLDIYVNSRQKWGRADDVADTVLETPHGTFKQVYEDAKSFTNFLIHEGRRVVEFVSTPKGQTISLSNFVFHDPQAAGVSGPAFIDLLNHYQMPPLDPPTASAYHADYDIKYPVSALWKLGCFNDGKGWRLLQNGKTVFEHEGCRLVNFRNRFLIVRPDGALAGEATKMVKIPSGKFVLEKIMGYGPWSSYRDVLRIITHMVAAQGPVVLATDGRRSENYHQNFSQYGFEADDQNRIRDVEETHPPEDVLTFSNGWAWRRMPYHPIHKSVPEHHGLPGERYGLADPDGHLHVYLLRDKDGFLHTYSASRGDSTTEKTGLWITNGKNSIYPDQGIDPNKLKPYWKYFTAFLEKSRTKLSANQYRTLGIYTDSKGRIKSLKDDPMLSQYLEGKIKFPDGYELIKEYAHSNEWRLYRPKRDGDESYDYPFSRRMLTITLTNEGIDKIEPENREAKRNFHKFMPYLKTLVQIFARVVGEEIED